RRVALRRACVCALLTMGFGLGCAQEKWVRVREVPANPLAGPLQLLSPSGPQPTDRTKLLARRYDLEEDLSPAGSEALVKLAQYNEFEPSTDKLYALAELSYLAGKHSEARSRK